MLVAVVVSRTAVLGDGHRHIDRADRLVTVNHIECHVGEVIANVGEHLIGQTHIGRTGICSRSRSRSTTECDIAVHIVKGCTSRGGIAVHAVRLTVVVHRAVSTRNRHCSLDRLDHQLTVSDHEGHIREVGVRVREVVGCQRHRVRTGIRTAHRSTSAEREV